MLGALLASLSLALKQPLPGCCDIETTHGDALVTKHGDYCTFVRIGGMKRMATRDDVTRLANSLRLDLSGALESKGHAIVGWYLSDPDMAAREIERINMDSCRRVGREVGLDLSDILDERMRLWSEVMRWETSCFILWTRRAVLTKEETKQMKEESGRQASSSDRRRPAVLSPLRIDGGSSYGVRQPGGGGFAGGRGRGEGAFGARRAHSRA
jgi:intracellular multiplication protein IcmB